MINTDRLLQFFAGGFVAGGVSRFFTHDQFTQLYIWFVGGVCALIWFLTNGADA